MVSLNFWNDPLKNEPYCEKPASRDDQLQSADLEMENDD